MAQRLRAPLALILGVLAVLFTVLSIDARMVRGLVLDTDRFVAVLGPTIDDPEVQLALSGAIADGVVDHLPQTDLTRWLPDAAGARVGETAREVIGSVVRDQTQTLLFERWSPGGLGHQPARLARPDLRHLERKGERRRRA